MATNESRVQPFWEPTLQMWRMQKSLYTGAQEKGYSQETRMLALRMYVEGSSQRWIARILKISPQRVSNWINAYVFKLPPVPMASLPKVAELNELYTFLNVSLSALSVYNIVRKYGKIIGIPNLAAHDLRRTYAHLGYNAGVPITQIKELLGHASLTKTQKYLDLAIDLENTAGDFVPLRGD